MVLGVMVRNGRDEKRMWYGMREGEGVGERGGVLWCVCVCVCVCVKNI